MYRHVKRRFPLRLKFELWASVMEELYGKVCDWILAMSYYKDPGVGEGPDCRGLYLVQARELLEGLTV